MDAPCPMCDGCEALKRDVNKWFVAWTAGHLGNPCIVVTAWIDERPPGAKVFCGHGCVVSWLSGELGRMQV